MALLVSRFYFIKLHALTAVKDWPSLEAFAKLRKSPIGYEPFVAHLVEKGHLKEGAKYVPRCEQKNRVVRFFLVFFFHFLHPLLFCARSSYATLSPEES